MNAIEEETELPETAPTPAELASNEQEGSLCDQADDGLSTRDGADGDRTAQVKSGSDERDRPTRRKLEEQLEALKRKEVELRRALVMADHPELADSIRILQGRTYALERVEAKLGWGLTKTELRRRETLQKKRGSLHEKRAELDAQITELDAELDALGVERQQAFEAERKHALEALLVALGTHDPALHAAGIEATELVPEIQRWLPEIEALAETLASKRTQAN